MRFRKIPKASQCDPDISEESMFTMRKHGKELNIILESSSSAKQPIKFGTQLSIEFIVEIDVPF